MAKYTPPDFSIDMIYKATPAYAGSSAPDLEVDFGDLIGGND